MAQYVEKDKISSGFYREFFNHDTTILLNNKDNIYQIVAEDKAAAVGSQLLMKNNFYYRMNLITTRPLNDNILHLTYYTVYNSDRFSEKITQLLIKNVKEKIEKLKIL